MLQLAALVFVEVLEHHGTFSKDLLRHAALVASLDLLLQIMLHPHACKSVVVVVVVVWVVVVMEVAVEAGGGLTKSFTPS